jgi:4-hydroxythreonine-4-phosphate dehydrogenase
MKPIAVTMGDPAGVGPELCLHLPPGTVVFGDRAVLDLAADQCRWAGRPAADVRHVADVGMFTPGRVAEECGRASFRFVEAAIAAALAGEVAAVCTLPINKEAWRAAGVSYPGHTELFAERTGAAKSCMVLTSDAISCALVTTHVGLRDVPDLLSVEKIVTAAELTADFLRKLRGREPRLAVCGLNPHAGEGGQFRDEEQRVIAPAVEECRRRGLTVEGPLPPDTAFVPARRSRTDGYICMYHDQGLIPLKALAFDSAVNVTLGLPIVRTSVDHGTAFDIAWRGVADPSSLLAAVALAARLVGTV